MPFWRRPSTSPDLGGAEVIPADRVASLTADVVGRLEGLLVVERRLLAVLEREDVRPIPALGQPFDPERHLAVAVARDNRVPDGTVVAEERRGYRLGARVLRHAEVVVARHRSDEPGGIPFDARGSNGIPSAPPA